MSSSILFIGPSFFGFEDDIIKELKKRYKQVFYKCEYPFKNPRIYYVIDKLCHPFNRLIWRFYEKSILSIIVKNKIKKVFIIRGRHLPETLIKAMSEMDLDLYHYQWDSVKNNPNAVILLDYCKYNFTFDVNDSEKYNNFIHLPLFYCWNGLELDDTEKNIDMLYLASYNDKRHQVLSELRKYADLNHLVLYYHLYLPIMLYVRMLFKGNFVNFKDVSFLKLSRKKYFNILSHSRIAIDFPSPTQTGSSMRTIESLSLKKKIITTNINVRKELFYNSDNIIFWPDDVNKIVDAISSPFNENSYNQLKSLDKWLKTIGI